jgi:hypothetical protein
MMGRLNMPNMFDQLATTENNFTRQREIISKACWGLFCFER